MRTLALLLLLSAYLCSCSSGLESDDDDGFNPGDSFYKFSIGDPYNSPTDFNHDFEGIETEWNLSSGIAVLGPEDIGEPVARLQLTFTATSDGDSVAITDAVLAYSNLRTGDASNLDSRLYKLSSTNKLIAVDGVNQNHLYISESNIPLINMERIDPQGSGEIIDVRFYFNATD